MVPSWDIASPCVSIKSLFSNCDGNCFNGVFNDEYMPSGPFMQLAIVSVDGWVKLFIVNLQTFGIK